LGSIAQTLNGAGLLEVNLGRNGVTSGIGMGGIDLGGALYTTAKRGIDMAGISIYGINNKDEAAVARQAYLYGDWTAENTSARIAGGIDTLELVTEGVLGKEGYGLTTRNGSGRNIYLTDQGNINNNALALQHESYRDGYVGNDNYLETRQAVLAHTEMAERMKDDGLAFLKTGNLGLEMQLYEYAQRTGNWGVFDQYSDMAYDSSADYWKLVKGDNGQWNWEKDGSLDFNFDLNDKEIAAAFFKTFGNKQSNADGIATISVSEMAKKATTLAKNLGLTGTVYVGKFIRSDGGLEGFISNTKTKVSESIERREQIASYTTKTAELMANGVGYQLGGGIMDTKTGIVIKDSPTMDCTALISYLTQTRRTSTAFFGFHASFEKTDVAMPGDVLIYFAKDAEGDSNNHGVILLENGGILESAFKKGPRNTNTRNHLETVSYKDYSWTMQPYALK
jgi:hypothetical protein